MLNVKLITALTVFFCLKNRLVSSNVAVDYCYSDDKHPYLRAGTKTAYEFQHGLIENTTLPNCKPLQIWMLIRHGTRYPGKDEVKSMKHRLPELQRSILENHEAYRNGSLCKKDLDKLKAWSLDSGLHKHNANDLTKQGEKDLLSLGERFKNYFPELLQTSPGDVLEEKYKFRSTSTERTILSMKSFIKGLFGNVTVNNAEVVPTAKDTLLKIYKICKAWLNHMNASSSMDEVNELLNGPIVREAINHVSQRLGFSNSLSFDDFLTMYTACVFENAWYVDKRSPWCAAFTKDELEVLEYEDDLFNYYHYGYGQSMSTAIGCPPLLDMFNHFSKLENEVSSSEEPQGVFYFAHSTLLQLLYTTMGLAKDSTPLKASNFKDMGNRKWSGSTMIPFAANIAAVFYKCDSSNKVRFYVNEKPLDFEGCEMGVCDWDYLKKKMEPVALTCNMDFCNK